MHSYLKIIILVAMTMLACTLLVRATFFEVLFVTRDASSLRCEKLVSSLELDLIGSY